MLVLRESVDLNRYFAEESFDCESFQVSLTGICCKSC